ncbi:MAG: hypothetical protein KAI39_02510 [Desulfobulbaceae bacterium]|nr:hypothetical protein [Desulfobulbaceae bacterium]
MKRIQTSICPDGKFCYGIHKPVYKVENQRQDSSIQYLGQDTRGNTVDNKVNFPEGTVEVKDGDWIFEIPNPFPFKGRTYIDKEWADSSADNPGKIRLPEAEPVSLTQTLTGCNVRSTLFEQLPPPLLLALATCSTDPEDLIKLAEISSDIEKNDTGTPIGLHYEVSSDDTLRPIIHNHPLFEAVANNPHLPDSYKIIMVIRPGAQGGSEIVGEWRKENTTHVFEYLRKNSYIPWGHYAANMADDAIRYGIDDLSLSDLQGMRHLYYQRSYIRVAEELGITLSNTGQQYTADELEALRIKIISTPAFVNYSSSTLWGWNFGFDYAPTHYRLHASHQQIHQQYALIPDQVAAYNKGSDTPVSTIPSYCCGDLISDLIEEYWQHHTSDFFNDYRQAIKSNSRMDSRNDLESSLVVWSDENAMLFVPKAQTSQWELQLMTLPDKDGILTGNIFETDSDLRQSLDTGILMAQKALAGLGAKMVTSIEYTKRPGKKQNRHQPLLYAFLPRLPESPGAFSEAQLRFINGHYPEDFAWVCRNQLIAIE